MPQRQEGATPCARRKRGSRRASDDGTTSDGAASSSSGKRRRQRCAGSPPVTSGAPAPQQQLVDGPPAGGHEPEPTAAASVGVVADAPAAGAGTCGILCLITDGPYTGHRTYVRVPTAAIEVVPRLLSALARPEAQPTLQRMAARSAPRQVAAW